MNSIQIYSHPDFGSVRTEIVAGDPLFCVADVCKILGHTNARVAIKMVDDDERMKKSLRRDYQPIGNNDAWFVTESGLYLLIFRSNRPEAKLFRKWVTGVVLPCIRKKGQYAVPRLRPELAIPDDIPNLPRNHTFNTKIIVVNDCPVREVRINKVPYYCMIDVLKAVGIATHARSQLCNEIYHKFTFKIRTKSNGRLARYITTEGLRLYLSRSKAGRSKKFLSEFLTKVDGVNKIDFDRFLDVIVKTRDESDRSFLLDTYKTLTTN